MEARGDVAELVLDDVEQRQGGGALAFRVVGDALVRLGFKLRA